MYIFATNITKNDNNLTNNSDNNKITVDTSKLPINNKKGELFNIIFQSNNNNDIIEDDTE